MGYIYKIVNKVNGKVYVGQTISTVESRWESHQRAWQGNRHCQALYKAFDKYGIDNFDIEPIERCDIEDLNEKEKYWIQYYDSYNNGYNLTVGGDGIRTLDYKLIRELWDSGLSTGEIADLIGATRQGIKKNLLDYDNYSIDEGRHRGSKLKGVTNGKPIEQYSLDGVYINTFPNATVAAESLGKGRSESNNIRTCANGKRKSAYGYRWKFVNKEDLHK